MIGPEVEILSEALKVNNTLQYFGMGSILN
jgi:hypothetical protein